MPLPGWAGGGQSLWAFVAGSLVRSCCRNMGGWSLLAGCAKIVLAFQELIYKEFFSQGDLVRVCLRVSWLGEGPGVSDGPEGRAC